MKTPTLFVLSKLHAIFPLWLPADRLFRLLHGAGYVLNGAQFEDLMEGLSNQELICCQGPINGFCLYRLAEGLSEGRSGRTLP